MATDKKIRVGGGQIAFPKWLSLSEAADYLGVGTKLLSSRCEAREITFVRVGHTGRNRKGRYRFRVQWLDDYLERITIHAHTPPVRNYARPRPLVTEIFIDPRDCGNPFED